MNNLIGRVVALRSAYASFIAVQQRVLPIEKSISNVPYARPFGMTKVFNFNASSLLFFFDSSSLEM